jgi:hypothetical protein
MVASVLLVAGLFCWLCAASDDAYFHTNDKFGIAVLPLMIPSLLLFAFKARMYLQKPYLSLPNYFMYVPCATLLFMRLAHTLACVSSSHSCLCVELTLLRVCLFYVVGMYVYLTLLRFLLEAIASHSRRKTALRSDIQQLSNFRQ